VEDKNYYETLGVNKDASQSDIKKAWRKKASAAHPDKGADGSEFKALAIAYKILSDPDKRERYDKGKATDRPTEIQELMQLFSVVLHKNVDNIETVDLVDTVRQQIKSAISEHTKNMAKQEREVAKLRKAVGRTKSKDNLLESVIEAEIRWGEQTISAIKEKLDGANKMLVIMEDWSYRVDEINQLFSFSQIGSTSTSTFY
jgi:curved DNA-binding protein CbpA